ncbi:3658_t:CDS:2 [Racocetra fulgida]|uniref:3658_t:CDS:1 n=1 Tax=Racocetra fulgida TaxID=60492 RepID=A0A9N9FB81_9GLOM|nr:3658_t:CDS:2 [Racocetra fulgida]
MVKERMNKRPFYINYDNLIAITMLHQKKLRKLKSSFMRYRIAVHHYLKENNFTYSCSTVSKLVSKLWKHESENVKTIYKRLGNEAKKKKTETLRPINSDLDFKETHISLSEYAADFKIIKQQKLTPSYMDTYPLTNVIFSEGLRKPYNNLLFDHYNRIQKLERELFEALEIDFSFFEKMGKAKHEAGVINYQTYHKNSSRPHFPLNKEDLKNYIEHIVNKRLSRCTFKQYIRHIKKHHINIDEKGSWNSKEFDPVIQNASFNDVQGINSSVQPLGGQPYINDIPSIQPVQPLSGQPSINDIPFMQPVQPLSGQPSINDILSMQPVQPLSGQPSINDILSMQPVQPLSGQPSINDILGTFQSGQDCDDYMQQFNDEHITLENLLLIDPSQIPGQVSLQDSSASGTVFTDHTDLSQFGQGLDDHDNVLLTQRIQSQIEHKNNRIQELKNRFDQEAQRINNQFNQNIQQLRNQRKHSNEEFLKLNNQKVQQMKDQFDQKIRQLNNQFNQDTQQLINHFNQELQLINQNEQSIN